MNKKRFLYSVLCAFGAAVMGACASELSSVWGVAAFTVGVGLMVFAMIKLSQ